MPAILGTDVALPQRYYTQEELAAAVADMLAASDAIGPSTVERFFRAVHVEGRHLALPLERYRTLKGFGERSSAWLECALPLGASAVRSVLEKSGLSADHVDLFVTSTVTGVAVPSLEPYLMNGLGFSPGCRRLPLFGLGCAGGAAGIARASDYLAGHPTHAALLLCVELCSLAFQPDHGSLANVVATGLFGDGAASVLLVGDAHPLARRGRGRVKGARSALFPDTLGTMGWEIVDSGFRVVLGKEVPHLARTALSATIRDFLASHGLSPSDVRRWIAHPGGPSVIDAIEDGLELPRGALDATRDSLGRIGNLSSASVLAVLDSVLAKGGMTRGDRGVLFAMGPGFGAEVVLLEW
jgi:alkylresorcinol/alkylpyrone synthase